MFVLVINLYSTVMKQQNISTVHRVIWLQVTGTIQRPYVINMYSIVEVMWTSFYIIKMTLDLRVSMS